MSVALDTNILIYAEGLNGPAKRNEIVDLLDLLPGPSKVLPIQVLGEFYRVLMRKGGYPRVYAGQLVLDWQQNAIVVPTTPDILQLAMEISIGHLYDIWDAIVVASAAASGCDILLSEDMHSGFRWAGVTVINPFATPRSQVLVNYLANAHG